MFKITRVGVVSLGKVMALSHVIVGLIGGLIFTILAVFGLSGVEIQGVLGTVIKFGAIIIFPIVGGIAGFIQGVIAALIFNLAVKMSNGLELNIDEIQETPAVTQRPTKRTQVKPST